MDGEREQAPGSAEPSSEEIATAEATAAPTDEPVTVTEDGPSRTSGVEASASAEPSPVNEVGTQPTETDAAGGPPSPSTDGCANDGRSSPLNAAPRPSASAPKRLVLPNAKVGVEYRAGLVDREDLGLAEAVELDIEGLEASGLRYDREANDIVGVAVKPGDFTLRLKVSRVEASEIRLVLALTVIADPRALWKSKPSNREWPYWKEDAESKLCPPRGGKRLVAASKRGRSHAHEGSCRDDHVAVDVVGDWHVAIVADGAGSAEFSREGSRIACDSVLVGLRDELASAAGDQLDRLIAAHATSDSPESREPIGHSLYNLFAKQVYAAYKSIVEEAAKVSKPIRSFHTTLLFAIAKRYESGWFAAAYWRGDGGVALYKGGDVILLGQPDSGDFAGQTRFLTMKESVEGDDILRRIKFELTDDFRALVLMTDGVTDPMFETDQNLGDPAKWDSMWQDLSSLAKLESEEADRGLLDWLDFWSSGNHDDRTIAILS